jgi:energy-coupling factor transporter ATP-binding protein EcfA2
MKIVLKATYKSLDSFSCDRLVGFCIITGKNGSGKTQLIELIKAYAENQNDNFTIDVDRQKIQIEGLNHPTSNTLNSGNWSSKINEFFSYYLGLGNKTIILEKLYDQNPNLSLESISKEDLIKILETTLENEVRHALDDVHTFSHPSKVPTSEYANLIAKSLIANSLSFEIARTIAKKARKKISEINQMDFSRFPPDEMHFDRNHLFYSNVENIFYAYAKRRHLNHLDLFEKKEFGTNNDSISDIDFINRHRPPWQIMNEIFTKHGIDYYFEEFLPSNFVRDVPIEFKLVKKDSGKKVEFNNLSSGEKVIIALIIKVFTSEYYQKQLELPELIVLDEPDSHLHPQLSKLLIDVLCETFVKDLGIKVILTTHSPSTVALAPEESLYELQNEPATSLKKIKKDDALKLLTFGVPTLSIDYKNHRQIFVESPTDVFYFQSLYNLLSQHESLTFKPYFISYGKGKGNCDQVMDLVSRLRESGNEKSFGIVDWDGKRKSNVSSILIHGDNLFYSIENVLYNPIYLVALFLEIKGAENVFTELNFTEIYNQYELGVRESNSRLQEISNWIVNKICANFPSLSNQEQISIKFLNGKEIKLPKWYVEIKGHELEGKLKQTFKSLEGKFKSEGQFQEAITKVIAKSYPFFPVTSVELIRHLSGNS